MGALLYRISHFMSDVEGGEGTSSAPNGGSSRQFIESRKTAPSPKDKGKGTSPYSQKYGMPTVTDAAIVVSSSVSFLPVKCVGYSLSITRGLVRNGCNLAKVNTRWTIPI